MESNKGGLNNGAPAPEPSAGSAPKAKQEISGLEKKMQEFNLNDKAPAQPAILPPNAPTLGPRKRDRDSDVYISVDDIPDLRLNNEAQAPAVAPSPFPNAGSSPKAQCLGLGVVEQGAKK